MFKLFKSSHISQAVGVLLPTKYIREAHYFVGRGRLELPWITPLVPKTSAATSYATCPYQTISKNPSYH